MVLLRASKFVSDGFSGGLDQANTRTFTRHIFEGMYERYLKRIIDISAVLLVTPIVVTLLIFLWPLLLLDGGPIFYSQLRLGKGGRSFRLWKLRTMVVDADDALTAYLAANPAARDEWDRTQKLQNDPRVSRMGRVLRATSLDELPQLFNVLRGEMSLVGPRPIMPSQADRYPGEAYYRVRPGLTGFWQVSGRHRTSFASRAHYDRTYASRISLATDVWVIFATVRVVLLARGC